MKNIRNIMEMKKVMKKAMKKYCFACIWILTIVLHAAIYLSGFSLVLLGIAIVYIIGMMAALIVGEMRKTPVIGFEKLIFIGTLHVILLGYDVFAFLFALSLENGSFHAS